VAEGEQIKLLYCLGDRDPLDGLPFLIRMEALKSVSGCVASISPIQLVTSTTPKCPSGDFGSRVNRLAGIAVEGGNLL
jgi:hypothetical protein